jgi:glycosyltransferase involved in cell wall biosynthesis
VVVSSFTVTDSGELIGIDGKFFARGKRRLRVQGVTYGPFRPNRDCERFPEPDRVRVDVRMMAAAGINALRTYDIPPSWFLRLADEQGMSLLIDVPWPKHLCFLDSERLQKDARDLVRCAAESGRGHSCVLAYSIGNEIPTDIVRWHGARRVERFLAELADVCRQADSRHLVTYTSFPPTEFLDLSFLDFATFNVYLHDREAFCRYLFRLQNLVGDRPLLLGEVGMDTLRHDDLAQAEFLAGHLREAALIGVAGSFVFSWTDDWYRGDQQVEDWAFGITRADRTPKAAYHALQSIFQSAPAGLLSHSPRVSVVVCSYNGAKTLGQCLDSLTVLNYPDYEIIVVDDGSTDETPSILARFPHVRAVQQANRGLSAARNAGLLVATGEIIAFTDADCFADPDWLALLVHRFQRSNAAAVGGPNLAPPDGWLAACVAAAPGQPTHVLESDQVAEHIPGCNMAFRRQALQAINGFDPVYRKAGDDVDVCWRLVQAGEWITYAPGAFVWHHRRPTPRTYLRQQAGYGEAEALLRFKHPDKFNHRGDGKWRGLLYGTPLNGLRLAGGIIYRGVFATGLFQCIYQSDPLHWALFPCTLEWHALAGFIALVAAFWPLAWIAVGVMLGLSWTVALLRAGQTRLPPAHDTWQARLLVTALSYMQPLVRSWKRYQTRVLSYIPPVPHLSLPRSQDRALPLIGRRTVAYWNEQGKERTDLLAALIGYLTEHRWGKIIDSGWSDWDVEVYCHPWTVLQVFTTQENHGCRKFLIRVRYRQRFSGNTKVLAAAAVLVGGAISFVNLWAAWGVIAALALACTGIWWRGTFRAAAAQAVLDTLASKLGMIPCEPAAGKGHTVGRSPILQSPAPLPQPPQAQANTGRPPSSRDGPRQVVGETAPLLTAVPGIADNVHTSQNHISKGTIL